MDGPNQTTVPEPNRASTVILRALVYGGALAGLALLVAALWSDDPPGLWWAVGALLTAVCGGLSAVWIQFRLRHRTPEQRQRALAELADRKRTTAVPLERSRLAYRATRHKQAVLRTGVDGTAVITFLADGHRANEFRHLVYLELDVSVGGGDAYPVRTGEFVTTASAGTVTPGRRLYVKVDPTDPHRVAVDWERSLRLA